MDKRGNRKEGREIKTKYWLYFGLGVFVLTALGAGIGTFDKTYFWDSMYGILDWFAASILYFFYGALFGVGIDLYFNKKRENGEKIPNFFYYSLIFIVLSILVMFIKLKSLLIEDLWFSISYPFVYAPFFHGFSFSLLNIKLFSGTVIVKLVLDILLLGLLFSWIRLRINGQGSRLERNLLLTIFVILIVGMIKCALMIS